MAAGKKDAEASKLVQVRGKLHAERRAHDRTKRELAKAIERTHQLEEISKRLTAVAPADIKVPSWAKKTGRRKHYRATGLLQLSDLHLDEVVNLDEMSGMNEYNRNIAKLRLDRIVNGTVKMRDLYTSGLKYDGIVVALNGDILTGDIHEELARTNEAPTMASLPVWVPILASAIQFLADEFNNVLVVCTDGNHDRFYKKIPAKQRAESSIAWVLYNWLADKLEHDSRIEFSITTAPGQVFEIYNTKFHQIHGDGFRSAGGVGGIYPSMLKYLLRQDALWANHNHHIDYHLLGHWHQYLTGPNFIVNGSLKGYDEYAKTHGFSFELPRQAFAVVTPERKITFQGPVYADASP